MRKSTVVVFGGGNQKEKEMSESESGSEPSSSELSYDSKIDFFEYRKRFKKKLGI